MSKWNSLFCAAAVAILAKRRRFPASPEIGLWDITPVKFPSRQLDGKRANRRIASHDMPSNRSE